ncbi:MAG TPA: EAL domain-containing protein [Spongiibacteraceae bacterium]|nr:EAL domain-containing protein [Spongiibacteraceae bacterium]
MRNLTLLHRDLPLRWRYALALAIFAAALALRLLILPVSAGFRFITLYPATVAALYFCGTGPGLFVAALGVIAGYTIFPAQQDFSYIGRGTFMVGMYLFGTAAMAIVVRQMQNHAKNLYQTVAKLQDSENRFRSFMDNSNFIAWLKDEQGRYVFLSKPYEQRFELAPNSWLGRTDFDIFPPDLAQKFQDNDRIALRANHPIAVEETAIAPDGNTTYWLSSKFPYIDSKGNRYVGGIAVDITQRKIAEEKAESLAFYDPLTNLPNRRLLLDRLAHVMNNVSRQKHLGALLFIDLDNFKTLNDTYGHQRGDLLLQEVAQRLSYSLRKGDTLARFGGDEFVLLLENLSIDPLQAAHQTEVVAEKILTILRQPYEIEEHSHISTPSIGITLFGESEESIDEPLRRADLAMYEAKSTGRNTFRFFDPQLQLAVTARALLEADLRTALHDHQFELHFQAQMSSHDTLCGAEALLRWRHPQRGMISPAEFIPVAEESGLIIALGRWVLDSACAQLARWADHPQFAHIGIAVNVSPRQFHQPDFVEQVASALAISGADPKRLKLELTESLLIANVDDVIAKMTTLKAKGVGFSLDDFGTGYSSLAYLKRLPLNELKIDQSFIRDALNDSSDAMIITTIIALAKNLGLAVIAEGVETSAQRAFLAQQGCKMYQGYLFNKPMSITEFEAYSSALTVNA